jgi:hypothetical protein
MCDLHQAMKLTNAYKTLKAKYEASEQSKQEMQIKLETMAKEQKLFEDKNTKLANEVDQLRTQLKKLSQATSESSVCDKIVNWLEDWHTLTESSRVREFERVRESSREFERESKREEKRKEKRR